LSQAIDHWAMTGLELWFAALAMGAAGVTVLTGEQVPEPVQREYERQQSLAAHILRSLGLEEERITAGVCPSPLPPLGRSLPNRAPLSPRAFSGDRKREVLLRSLQQLQSGSSRTVAAIGLPSDACYGTLRLDPERCTLCLACATVCPTGAIRAETGDSSSALLFRELDCIQCGLCREACPETALELEPRLLLTDEAFSFRRLFGQELQHCPGCGRPVASVSMLRSIRERLRGHWMYQSASGGNHLLLCAHCKVRSALAE
jgi:ferredoxin